MERYDSYTDSSVKWIGEIPSHWKGYRLRNLGELYGGLTGKSGDDFKQDDHPMNRPYIPYTNIFRNTYISKEHVDYVVLEEGEKQNRVQQYDLFFLMSSENYDDLGKPCVLVDHVEELYLNSFCKGFRVRRNIVNPLFLNYQLLGDTHRKLVSVEGKGFTRINLRQDRLIDTPMVIPPLQEQEEIVGFLDRKTTLVDSLIEKTEKRIELLKEKRTSLINQVVTKGLNPDVEMKDSGVEWIGEIPSHWEIRKGSTLGVFSKGNGIKKDEVTSEGIPCVRYGELYTIYDHKVTQTVSFVMDDIGVPIEYGTLLMTGSGELVEDIGKCVVYSGEGQIRVGGDLIILVPSVDFNPLFLSYLMNSESIRIQREMSGRGGIIVHIYSKNFKDMKFSIPPLQEQEEIVEYLDEQTSIMDSSITTEEKRIELLKEYRQSLITEVVTGKVKVS